MSATPFPRRRHARRAGFALALCLAAAPGLAEHFPEPPQLATLTRFHPTAFAAGDLMGTLTWPEERGAERPRPAVVLVHDANGADARGDLYAEQLAGAGFVVLDLLSHPADPDAARRARDWLSAQPEVDALRIAGLGFGAGAQAVLAAGFGARVLLYPGCARLDGAAPAAPTLLLHGSRDAANPAADCRAAAARLGAGGSPVRHLVLEGGGYAWDHPAIGAPERVLLPSPIGPARVPAAPWPALAEMAASEVAGFLTAALRGPVR